MKTPKIMFCSHGSHPSMQKGLPSLIDIDFGTDNSVAGVSLNQEAGNGDDR